MDKLIGNPAYEYRWHLAGIALNTWSGISPAFGSDFWRFMSVLGVCVGLYGCKRVHQNRKAKAQEKS